MNFPVVEEQSSRFIANSEMYHVLLENSSTTGMVMPPYAKRPSTYNESPIASNTPEQMRSINGSSYFTMEDDHEAKLLSAQLRVVHDGMDLQLEEYPIQALFRQAVLEHSSGACLNSVLLNEATKMHIVTTECNGIPHPLGNIAVRVDDMSQQLSSVEMLASESEHTVSCLMRPQNDAKHRNHTKIVQSFPYKTLSAARTVPFAKHLPDVTFPSYLIANLASTSKNTTIQKKNNLRRYSQLKRPSSQVSNCTLLASFCPERVTLYKVVSPGRKSGRLLLNHICENEGTVASAGMSQPTRLGTEQRVLRHIQLDVSPAKNSRYNRRSQMDNIIPRTGVQTRSGRFSKPPQTLSVGSTCQVMRNNKDRRSVQNVNSVETFLEMSSRMEENKENPGRREVKPAPANFRRKAKVQPQHQCGTCHKIYLGRRMARHLRAYPTHVTLDKLEPYQTKDHKKELTTAASASRSIHNPTLSSPTQLYRLLVQLVTAPKTESEQRTVLLREISQFVELIRSRVPNLIVPGEQEDNETVYVDQNVADVLQLNPGNYRIRMDAFAHERKNLSRLADTRSANPINDTYEYEKNMECSNVSEKIQSNAAFSSFEALLQVIKNSGIEIPFSDGVKQEKGPNSSNNSSVLELEATAASSFEAILQDFAELEQREQLGLLPHLPLPSLIASENEDSKERLETPASSSVSTVPRASFSEPIALSNQITTAFGRECQLSEDLFPSPSQGGLCAFEELTNLSELCSPQVLGVPSGTVAFD